jgi:hypothetical protein
MVKAKSKKGLKRSPRLPSVYIFAEDPPPNPKKPAFKIGKSESVSERKQQLQAGTSCRLVSVASFETNDYTEIEAALHQVFVKVRIYEDREWFWLTWSDISNIINPEWRAIHVDPIVAKMKAKRAKKLIAVSSVVTAPPTPVISTSLLPLANHKPIGSMPAPEFPRKMTQWKALLYVLSWYGRPLHFQRELTPEIVRLNLITCKGKTLAQSIRVVMGRHIEGAVAGNHQQQVKFHSDGVYGLV